MLPGQGDNMSGAVMNRNIFLMERGRGMLWEWILCNETVSSIWVPLPQEANKIINVFWKIQDISV
jgi:hypothetical protein